MGVVGILNVRAGEQLLGNRSSLMDLVDDDVREALELAVAGEGRGGGVLSYIISVMYYDPYHLPRSK